MNQRYLDYAQYNIWANNRLISCLLEQKDALLTQGLIGSFPNIRKTILHIWFAELGWLSRLKTNEWSASKANDFSGTNYELFKEWQHTSKAFRDFVDQSDLEKLVSFDHKEESYAIPAREIVQTVFNHGTYHRGQVVLMLRQLDVSSIPQTDYIEWVRENESAKFSS